MHKKKTAHKNKNSEEKRKVLKELRAFIIRGKKDYKKR